MPHSFLLGHLWAIAKITINHKFPPDAHGQWVFLLIKEEYPEVARDGIIYMDTWPISHPLVAVFHPDMMAQFTQVQSLPKFWWQSNKEFKHFSGGQDLVNLEGQEWKTARASFNPGFSAKNLLSLIPWFVEEAMVFRERFKKVAASGEIIRLEDDTTNLTFDIIARAVLGTRMHSQIKEPPFLETLRKQLKLIYFNLDMKKQLSPTRHLKHWTYNRAIRKALAPYIQDAAQNHEGMDGPKTVVSLAVKSYVSEGHAHSGRGAISTEFVDSVVKNIKMFLFAGHDTTATTLASTFSALSRHPEKIAKLRQEHDAVLGSDPTKAAERITADPTVLNQLPYTLAVIKETLRLYPPVGGTIRQAPEGFMLTNPQSGKRYPVHGFMLHSSTSTLGRCAEYWPEHDKFIPERFMAKEETDPLHPVKNALQPFGLGPRNCIGQELVTLEIRLILALTIREYDIEEMYPEDAPTWFGDNAYQVAVPEHVVTAHIKDGLPVKIKARLF
ncbi:cytochrome P450 [Xylariales sp. AK1849]|nr:cytochrome P450 [Xylariales sp. AK1849]